MRKAWFHEGQLVCTCRAERTEFGPLVRVPRSGLMKTARSVKHYRGRETFWHWSDQRTVKV